MTRLKLQIRRYGRYAALLVGVALVGLAGGAYILLQERFVNPFADYYPLKGEFSTVAAVAPGLGEPVNVAGVRVGVIKGVSLNDGRGVVSMNIDRHLLPHLYADATAALVPNTPLKDMQVDIFPGHQAAGQLPRGTPISVSQTTTPIDSDELLNSLDADTRTWFQSLIADLGTASRGRGADLARALRALGPTTQDLRSIGDELARRRHAIAHLVHNLSVLTRAASTKDRQLQMVADAGNATLQALASQNVALRQSIAQLPGTLQTARRTLSDTAVLADQLGPTATALEPTARRLPAILRELPTLFRGAAVLPAKQALPFVHAALPLARMIPPLAHDVERATPPLIASFKVLQYVINELAYKPGAHASFLYWLAWFAHDGNSFLSTQDANGSVWRGAPIVSCSSLNDTSVGPLLAALLGITPSTC